MKGAVALLCIGAALGLVGFANRPEDDSTELLSSPTTGEQIAQAIGGAGLLFVVIGLLLIARAVLRD